MELSPNQEHGGGHLDAEYRYHSELRTGKAGRRRTAPRKRRQPIAQALVRLVRHCFPWFWDEPEAIDDARFLDNWCTFTRAKTETVICSRQMTNVPAVTDWEQLGRLRVRAIKDMVRNKQLQQARLLGHLMMVSDGTGIYASSEPHCPQCLTQRHQDGSVTYMHQVLEVKVIGWNGWAFSVMTEPQLNPEDGHYDKQDCESKAFKRMLPRLKEQFPRERIVHLLDALHCNGPAFHALQALRHKFICGFKPGSIPTLYEEALALLPQDLFAPNPPRMQVRFAKAPP